MFCHSILITLWRLKRKDEHKCYEVTVIACSTSTWSCHDDIWTMINFFCKTYGLQMFSNCSVEMNVSWVMQQYHVKTSVLTPLISLMYLLYNVFWDAWFIGLACLLWVVIWAYSDYSVWVSGVFQSVVLCECFKKWGLNTSPGPSRLAISWLDSGGCRVRRQCKCYDHITK